MQEINYDNYELLTEEMNHEKIWEDYVKKNKTAICGRGCDSIQEIIKHNTALYKALGIDAYLQQWGKIIDVGARYNILQSFLTQYNTYYPCDLIQRMPNTIKVNQDCILPFEDNFADGIVSLNTFQHLTPKQRLTYIKEFYRVLMPRGKAIISFTSNLYFKASNQYCFTGNYLIPIVNNEELKTWQDNISLLDIKQRCDGLTTAVFEK